MPVTLSSLPVRVQVGDGEPVQIGTWEVRGDVDGRHVTVSADRAQFAEILRRAADEIAPRPRLHVHPDPPHIAAQIRDLRRGR